VLLAGLAAAVVFWLLRDSAVDPLEDEADALVSSTVPERAPLVVADEPQPQGEVAPPLEARSTWAKRIAIDEEPPAKVAAAERLPAQAPVSANPRLVPRGVTQGASDGWSGPKNPRTAPPGTSEANAEALRKLPVARADKPPLAGVGALGIHIDEISIGSLYDAGKCSGHDTGFSAQRSDRVSACFRIVHPRTTQQVNVLWHKDGEVMRRTKMTIPSSHAYRTRAFIVLRDGDAGRWTVRVLSSDDVELAQARFVVQP
jgi:hypothetical protein